MTDEFTFEDEPEDAWDIDDAFLEQAANLFLRLDFLDGLYTQPAQRYRPLLQELEQRLRPWRARDDLDPRQQLRVSQLVEDLIFLQDRDDRGDYHRGE